MLKKPLHQASVRLQNNMTVQKYSIDVVYRSQPGKYLTIADILSQAFFARVT